MRDRINEKIVHSLLSFRFVSFWLVELVYHPQWGWEKSLRNSTNTVTMKQTIHKHTQTQFTQSMKLNGFSSAYLVKFERGPQ